MRDMMTKIYGNTIHITANKNGDAENIEVSAFKSSNYEKLWYWLNVPIDFSESVFTIESAACNNRILEKKNILLFCETNADNTEETLRSKNR